MLGDHFKKFFGDSNEREVKKIKPRVQQINDLESRISSLTDEQLQAKTPEFKQRFENGETLTISCRRRSPSFAKPASAFSTCGTSMCSSSAESPCIRGESRK